MSRSRPTAAERTVSMFTGLTDLDSDKARDGTGEARARNERKTVKTFPAWRELDGKALIEWYGPSYEVVRWDKATGEYVLSVRERVRGRYPTLTEAIVASDTSSNPTEPK